MSGASSSSGTLNDSSQSLMMDHGVTVELHDGGRVNDQVPIDDWIDSVGGLGETKMAAGVDYQAPNDGIMINLVGGSANNEMAGVDYHVPIVGLMKSVGHGRSNNSGG